MGSLKQARVLTAIIALSYKKEQEVSNTALATARVKYQILTLYTYCVAILLFYPASYQCL